MGWILLEAGVALLLGIFIVWWTVSARRRPPSSDATQGKRDDQ
jgi:hypothetical protein